MAVRIAVLLGVPLAYLYCDDDELARALLGLAGVDGGTQMILVADIEREAKRAPFEQIDCEAAVANSPPAMRHERSLGRGNIVSRRRPIGRVAPRSLRV